MIIKNVLLTIVLLTVLLTASFTVSADETNNTKSKNDITQIEHLFKHYMDKYNHFIATDELKIKPALYNKQVMLISGKGTTSTLSPEAMDKGVTAFLAGLKSKGVKKIAWENVEIQLLANNIALASNIAVRYLGDGSIYNKVGATYFLNKSSTGWSISAFAIHSDSKSLKFSTQH